MPVLDKKTRMISFRLSESEYISATRCCPAHGVRSVSTLARNATIDAVNRVEVPARSMPSAASTEILLQLQHQILWLRAELDRITGLLSKPSAPAISEASSLPQ